MLWNWSRGTVLGWSIGSRGPGRKRPIGGLVPHSRRLSSRVGERRGDTVGRIGGGSGRRVSRWRAVG